MKKNLFLILICLLSINLAAQSQDFQPFKAGFIYRYIANDSIYSMRIDTVKMVNGETVFVFNQTVKKGIIRTGTSSCIGKNTLYHVQKNNQFGHIMKKSPNGNIIFKAEQGHEFLLKPQQPVGSSWTVCQSPFITATVVSIVPETFAGITDDVVTINLSGVNQNRQVKLSRNHGFVKAPNFMAYITNSDFKKRDLQIHKLPEAITSPFPSINLKIYDFQPGDKFSYFTDSLESAIFKYHIWEQVEVLTRQNSPFNDFIIYTLARKKYTKSMYMGTYWIVSPPDTQTLYIDEYNNWPFAGFLTGESVEDGSNFYNSGTILTKITKSPKFNQRESSYFINADYYYYSNCKEFSIGIDEGSHFEVTEGLGRTYRDYRPGTAYNSRTTLQAYIKGTETYGTWPNMVQIMGNSKESGLAAINAYPNPFTSEVSLQFSSSFLAGKATVLVSNVLGQEVLKQEITVTPGQENRLEMSKLPKGIYVLKAEQHGKAFTTRLIKE